MQIIERSKTIQRSIKSFGLAALTLAVMTTSCKKGHNKVELAEDTRPTVNVTLSEAGGTDQAGFYTVSGKIRAERSVDVTSRMMGAINNMNAKVGDRVVAGQTLATISNTDISAKAAQADAGILEAETALQNMERDLARIESLFEKQSATQKELDDIRTARDMMAAKLEQAREMKNEINAMLSYTVITAPFTGVITEKYMNSGEMASPGRPIFHLESGTSFQAEAMIPESRITGVQVGDAVTVILKSTGQEISGKVVERSQSSIRSGGQYVVKIDMDKADLKDVDLLSGMFINVRLQGKAKSAEAERITVEKEAIVTHGQLTGIYTVSEQQTAVLRWVRLGSDFGDEVEVLAGLSSGEAYILSSDGRLLNGVKVEVK